MDNKKLTTSGQAHETFVGNYILISRIAYKY